MLEHELYHVGSRFCPSRYRRDQLGAHESVIRTGSDSLRQFGITAAHGSFARVTVTKDMNSSSPKGSAPSDGIRRNASNLLASISRVSWSRSAGNRHLTTESKNERKKPNLRKPPRRLDGPKTFVAFSFVVFAIYLYPTIFKPLFGISNSGHSSDENMKEKLKLIEEHRPSYMPKWQSPFGPREKG